MCGFGARLFVVLGACGLLVVAEVVLLNINVDRSDSRALDMTINIPRYNGSISSHSCPLHLVPEIASPWLRVVVHNGTSRQLLQSNRSLSCHYRYLSAEILAVMNDCQNGIWHGYIQIENITMEIRPLPLPIDGATHMGNSEKIPPLIEHQAPHLTRPKRALPRTPNQSRPTIELAVFLDEAAYRLFAPHYADRPERLRDMLLAYVNAVQALYHHESLGTAIDLVVVYMELMQRQPAEMPHHRGERTPLLDSFCAYQMALNPEGDEAETHWDMAVYLSALDFHAWENGRWNGATMGLATVSGVCLERYACVIAEFGTVNAFGKPYPSAGFTSVYILAHEIGHNLGMHHDSFGNSCPQRGHVMSSSRGTRGETTWSKCSARVAAELGWAKCLFDNPPIPPAELDHSRHMGYPGQKITAKEQCELLLIDRDAIVAPFQQTTDAHSADMCQSLQCRSPHRDGFYFAGPALTGTECAADRWCDTGRCVERLPDIFRPAQPPQKGGWSAWHADRCESGCLRESMGFQRRRRRCDNPTPVGSAGDCEGSAYDTVGCSDTKLCLKTKRKTAVEYATQKCAEFGRVLPALEPNGPGLQAEHEQSRLWMGCAIFCKRRNSPAFYSPRIELNTAGHDPYFPDGTLCHRDPTTQQPFYCVQHHCLPENFQLNRVGLPPVWLMQDQDAGDGLRLAGNAGFEIVADDEDAAALRDYHSVGADGRALRPWLDADELRRLNTGDGDGGGDGKGVVIDADDYVELPAEVLMKYARV